jgi:small subunit ribosomal protein S6
VSETHLYDLNLILDPGLNEAQLQTEKDAVAALVERHEGEIAELDEWGNKRLAYEIRKGREGYYLIYRVKLPKRAPKALEASMRLRDNVMRVLVVRDRPEWRTRKVKAEAEKEVAAASA